MRVWTVGKHCTHREWLAPRHERCFDFYLRLSSSSVLRALDSLEGRTSCVLGSGTCGWFWGAVRCHGKCSLVSAGSSPGRCRALERGTALPIYLILPAASLSRCVCVTSGSPRTAVLILPRDIIDRFHSDPF